MAQEKNAAPSFEGAVAELEQIVKNLETGKTNLDDMVKAYERGMELKNFCEQKLKEAQMKIEQISVSSSGAVSTTPFSES